MLDMLELKDISFEVSGDSGSKEIIRNMNLLLPEGQVVALTGPNGGGKSTLAKLIAGIRKPSSGHILFQGEDITPLGVTERAKRGIGFAFQQPVRFKGITVLDLIRIAAGKEMRVSQACEYLSEVGLCARDYIRREVDGRLSGGELKRIEIATVLARLAPLSIFDEPEAGIDLWSFQKLVQVFGNMKQKLHGSILVITHQERILSIADEIVVVAEGQIQRMGPRDEMLPGLVHSPNPGGCRFYQEGGE